MCDRRSGLADHLGLKPMSEGNLSYLCEGFYSLEANDLTEAASLAAVTGGRNTIER
jgi:hypothetical protein